MRYKWCYIVCDRFWDEKVAFTPESRVAVHEHMKQKRERQENKCGQAYILHVSRHYTHYTLLCLVLRSHNDEQPGNYITRYSLLFLISETRKKSQNAKDD